MTSRPWRVMRWTWVGLLFLGAIGCKQGNPNLTARLDQSLYDRQAGWPVVEVHFVAVPEAEVTQWRQMPLGEYWSANGLSRKRNPYRQVLQLNPSATSRSIPGKDPIWEKWNEAGRSQLFVLADLAGVGGRGESADPRRTSIPIDREHFKLPPEITFNISRTGITAQPQPTPKKKSWFGS